MSERRADNTQSGARRGADALGERVAALEQRLARLEALLGALIDRVEPPSADPDVGAHTVDERTTPAPSFRHGADADAPGRAGDAKRGPSGGEIPGTGVPCTDEVLERLARIPVGFVQRLVAQKVAAAARAEGVRRVDVMFFERAATF